MRGDGYSPIDGLAHRDFLGADEPRRTPEQREPSDAACRVWPEAERQAALDAAIGQIHAIYPQLPR